MAKETTIWIDAREFTDYGGWLEDTQFVYLMGSAYLIAAAPGIPVEDATTEVEIPESRKYRIWVRARNWLRDYAPGQFQLIVDGVVSDKIFGAAPSEKWLWETAGDFDLEKGRIKIALHDLTGYFARCAAIILTTDLDYTPPQPVDEMQSERSRLKDISLEPELAGEFDVIVVGGGPAGVPAAVAAARLGAKTALIHNRPVLGGNASTEAGVGFGGAAGRQPNAREGGMAEEIRRIRDHHSTNWTKALEMLTEPEENLSIFYNKHVMDVEMEGHSKIASAKAIDTKTGTYYLYRGKMFIDCSGDGWVGYYAGAKYRVGREAQHEYNESMAPEIADNITMSGCLMGNGLAFRAKDTGKPVSYTPPPWAPKLPEGEDFGRTIRNIGGHWWVETPGELDDIWEGERVRDELIRISFAFFGYLKNSWPERQKAANYKIVAVPIFNAKRESRRFIGDYVLTENDCTSGRSFPDTIAHAGWPLDVHHPRGIFSGREGPYYCNPSVPLVHIPYRCLYSVNIDNLLFAGRDVSVTHIALGTVRVQNTLATFGQAAGTAAVLCLKHHTTSRGIYHNHIEELQQTLLKHDQYIPGFKNEDSADLALKSRVAASSASQEELCDNMRANCRPENVINGYSRIYDKDNYAWVSDPNQDLPQWIELRFDEPVEINTVYLTFDTDMNSSPRSAPKGEYVPQCVRDYDLTAFNGSNWVTLATEKDNYLRRRIHRFDLMTVSKLKLTVHRTGGDKSARVFEIRAYKE